MKHCEAWYGTQLIDAGKKRNGSPRRTLVTLILVAHTATDARALEKAHPHLKFIERDARSETGAGKRPAKGARA